MNKYNSVTSNQALHHCDILFASWNPRRVEEKRHEYALCEYIVDVSVYQLSNYSQARHAQTRLVRVKILAESL